MKRWAIARMGDYEGDGSSIPKFNLYTDSSRIWSKPGLGFCFGQIAAKDLTGMQNDPDIYILPDGAMDMSVGSIPISVRTTMKSRMEAAGFVYTGIKTSWTVRQMLQFLKDQIQPGSVEAGDVRDVEG